MEHTPQVCHGYAPGTDESAPTFRPPFAVAISREAGARGRTIARRTAELLGWQFVDQETLEYMTQNLGGYPTLEESVDAAANAWIESRLAELTESYRLPDDVRSLARVVLEVTVRGECVILGRGAGWFLSADDKLFVRLVAPQPDRVAYVSQLGRLAFPEAQRIVEQRDETRRQFITGTFGLSPDDATQYDMVLNVARLGTEACAAIVATAAREKDVRRLRHMQ
jgi:cytidylate kinase